MALFNNKNKQTLPVSNCEFEEINLQRYSLSPYSHIRKIQLSAMFIAFKKNNPDASYSIQTTAKTFTIPEEFEMAEILAIASFYEVKEWNIFIDNEHYVDIDFDTVKINGELDFIDKAKEIVNKFEKFSATIEVADFSFNKYSEWLWEKYLSTQYENCIQLGNKYLKFGDFFVYDDEYDEFKIEKKEDFDAIKRKKYILLKSKLKSERIVLIDMEKRQVLATNLDELEKEYLEDTLKCNLEK